MRALEHRGEVKWCHIQDVMRRLRFSNKSRNQMVSMLRKGLAIRIAKGATIDTFITEKEAELLLQRKSIRKLEVLVAASKSSNEWVDASKLPFTYIEVQKQRINQWTHARELYFANIVDKVPGE